MNKFVLPELPYDYAALEPHISAKIMQLHHSKHHNAYVSGANIALEQMQEARENNALDIIPKLQKDFAFYYAGHINHSIFWTNLSPETQEPMGELKAAIDEFFGDFAKFKAHFTKAAMTIQGSGWAILSFEPITKSLVIEQMYDQQNNIARTAIPLLMLDMWEHAFYLDYLNVKDEYVAAFFNIINWENVLQRFENAKSL